MPRYEITSPDGKRFEITAPDGATESQVMEFARKQFNERAELKAAHDAETKRQSDPTGSFGENMLAGVGRGMTELGRGVGQRLGLVSQEAIDEARQLDGPLMGTAGGLVGDITGKVVTALPTALIPGANAMTGAALTGATMGALTPTATGESVAANTAIGGVAGAAGKVIGDKIASAVTNRLASKTASAAAAKEAGAVRDATLAESRAAGLVVPPSQANPTTVNRALEGFSGKIQTGQVASTKNQKVINDLSKQALGIADDGPITKESLTAIRAKAGEAYEALRGVGTINADKQFASDLSRITQKFEGAAKDFPDLAKNEIGEIVASVNKQSFSADSAIDAISILRERASSAYGKGDKSLGNAYRQTSQALEDAIERNLIEGGNREVLKAYQAARSVIAKTYSVEGALNSSGNVNPQKLAQQLRKGKPLTDELKLVAKFADQFPKAAQNVDQIGSVPGVSPLDYLAGMGMSTLDLGLGAASVAARPTVRSLILSPQYQRAMTTPNYTVGSLTRIAPRVAGNNTLRRLLPGMGAAAALDYAE